MIQPSFSGHGEWEDPLKTRCRIIWRKPEQLASDIYDWSVQLVLIRLMHNSFHDNLSPSSSIAYSFHRAITNGYINSVCTVYELHSGKCVFIRIVVRNEPVCNNMTSNHFCGLRRRCQWNVIPRC